MYNKQETALDSKAYARGRMARATGLRPAFLNRDAAESVLRVAQSDLARAVALDLSGRASDARRRIAKAQAFLMEV